jgi:hypothetical protein
MDIADSEPVVLLGRGGSGTRLLAELALGTGVFLGNELNVSRDSVEWVDVIYALALAATAADADGVRPDGDACARDRLRRCAARVLAAAGLEPSALWGWKLPETMLIVPDVVGAFPRGRFVHLVRHPLTSALRRTHITSRLDNPIGAAVLATAYRDAGLDPAGMAADDAYVHNAVSWNFQVRRVLDALACLPPGARALQLRYEDLCAAPLAARERLARFLNQTSPATAAAPAVDAARTNPVSPGDERIARVRAICGATAARLGYAFDG